MTTPAIVFTGVNTVETRRIEMPPPGPGEAQVETMCSTISAGTEGWVLQNRFTWAPTRYPCVPGYQRVGRIIDVGPGVGGWQVGDRVMATIGQWDGPVCPFWGSHIAVGNTPASQLFQLDDTVDDVDASGAVVAQVGYNAASRAVAEAGEWVLVLGDGLIGQCAAQAARARGLRVMLAGHRPERLELAAGHSADQVINTHLEDLKDAVQAYTGGNHVPVILDTVQSLELQEQYMPVLEHGRGQIVYSGFTPAATWADMARLQQQEVTTHFVSGWNRTRMEATLRLMSLGKMRLRPLITHRVHHLSGPEMYRKILYKSEPFLGITLEWTAGQ